VPYSARSCPGKQEPGQSTSPAPNSPSRESFFGLLKRERVNRVRYRTRDEARADLFEYIEVFYNRKRRHGYLGNISPADFEQRSTGSF
jgi:putative transposase